MSSQKITVVVHADNPAEAKEKAIKIMNKYISINNKTYVLTQRDLFVMCTEIIVQNIERGEDHNKPFDKDLVSFAGVCREYKLDYNDFFNMTFWEEFPEELPTWKQFDEIMDDDIIPPNTSIDPADISDIFITDKLAFINFGDVPSNYDCSHNDRHNSKADYLKKPEIKSCYFVKVCAKN